MMPKLLHVAGVDPRGSFFDAQVTMVPPTTIADVDALKVAIREMLERDGLHVSRQPLCILSWQIIGEDKA